MYTLRQHNVRKSGLVHQTFEPNYDDVKRHYHVINNLTGAMAKKYLSMSCNKICRSDVTHVCDQTSSDCATSPPFAFGGSRIPYEECNRLFRSQSCFDNHKRRSTAKKISVCWRKRFCSTCGVLASKENHEYNKRYCEN